MLTKRSSTPLKFFLFFLIFSVIAGMFSFLANRYGTPTQAVQNAPQSKRFCIVLDAGHGGEDGGAVSDSGIFEKDLNLAIAKKLATLLELNGVDVIMTRTEDVLLYDRTIDYHGRKKVLDLAARRKIAEEAEDCMFVSIHMNAYPLPQYSGLQVWYSPNHETSYTLAQEIQNRIQANLQPQNNRKIKSATTSIYLLHHLQCPAVLVECGFLSNPEEAQKLADETYQNELAFFLFTAIMGVNG